jgi:hypothetical protein
MLKKNIGYQQCPLFQQLQGDIEDFLETNLNPSHPSENTTHQ